MACACKTSKHTTTTALPVVQQSIPHEVKPGESCIFCADKHVAVAYTVATTEDNIPAVIGELELARRHTRLEFRSISDSIAETITQFGLRNTSSGLKLLSGLLPVMTSAVKDNIADAEGKEGSQYSVLPTDVVNPFIGEVHLCAAYRLAFEVGYMIPNRDMIIGDLVAAREHFVRFDAGVQTQLRELRHRIQTNTAADLNIYWPYVCNGVSKLIKQNLKMYTDEYAETFRAYLLS